jgi:ribosome biogenesis GTPase
MLEDNRELIASAAGRLQHDAAGRGQLPTVGDWVCASVRGDLRRQGFGGHAEHRAVIHRVLDRRTKIARKQAGFGVDEQVLAANVDTVFLVTSLNQDLNARRIERYLALVRESGAQPVVLLTKADLCDDVANMVTEIVQVAASVPVHVVSALTGTGLDTLAAYLEPGQTSVLLGSSGVGKSTLVNRLLGEERLEVRDIRARDDRGRHATSSRQLLVLPGGGLIIDTPGIRELQLWIADEGLGQAFPDVEDEATRCRFTTCTHAVGTPDCAVQAAIDRGLLSPDRLANWLKVRRELTALAQRQNTKSKRQEQDRWKARALKDKQRYDPEPDW